MNSITFNTIEQLRCSLGQKSLNFHNVLKYRIDKEFQKEKVLYSELLDSLFGIFPMDLFKELSTQQKEKIIVDTNKKNTSSWQNVKNAVIIPPEHLGNYEWRFTRDSALKIARSIDYSKNICCLGTPSVALELATNNSVNCTLLDINKPEIEAISCSHQKGNLNCFAYNVIEPLNSTFLSYYDTVVIDPPWYLDYYELFILRATQLLKKDGGTILMPVFPILSRQNAIKDLLALKSIFKEMGCEIENSLGFVDFDMPRFEEDFLVENNIPIPNRNWRKAELLKLSFLKTRTSVNFETSVVIHDYVEWERYYNSETNNYILINKDCIDGAVNGANFKKDRLLSISRKENNKTNIAVWQHDNEIIRKI